MPEGIEVLYKPRSGRLTSLDVVVKYNESLLGVNADGYRQVEMDDTENASSLWEEFLRTYEIKGE